MELGNNRRRVAEVRVKLQPEMLAAFDAIARRRGLPAATLACVVIGEYVDKQAEAHQLQMMAAKEMSAGLLGLLESSGRIDDAMAHASTPEATAAVLRALAEEGAVSAGGSGSSAAPEAAALPASVSADRDRARSAT